MLLNYWFKAWFWPFLPYVKTAYLGSKRQLSGRGWCKYWPWASRGAELRLTPWPDAHRTMVATALTHQWNTGNRGRRPGMSFSLHSSSWVLEPGYGRDIQVSPPPPPPAPHDGCGHIPQSSYNFHHLGPIISVHLHYCPAENVCNAFKNIINEFPF